MIDPRVARSREAVLAAALDIMNEGGVRAFSIDAVSARSGVAKTTIYRHWDTRSDLLADVVASLHRDRPVPDHGSLRDDLHDIVATLAGELATADWPRGLASTVGEAEHDAELAELHREMVVHFQEPTRTVVRRAVDRGEVASDIDVELAAELVFGPLFYRRLVLHGTTEPREVDELVDLICRALQEAT